MVPGLQAMMASYSRYYRQTHKDSIANRMTRLEGKRKRVEIYVLTEM